MNKKGVMPEIWSYGHRNPLGAAIDPSSKKLWVHEMGPHHGNELNIALAGKNYGWPVVSNGEYYNLSPIPHHETMPNFVKPIHYWHPAVSPSGLIFYTASLMKGWNGNMLLGSLSTQSLVRLTIADEKIIAEERIWLNSRIRDVIQAPDGSVWLLTDHIDGELLRLSPQAK